MKINRFRAWDTKTNKMITTGFHLIGEVTMFGLIETYIYENRCEAEHSLSRLNDIIEMQWTGLVDKNKKDIYEGDIVKHKFRRIWQTEEHTSTVVWNQEYCCYYLNDGVSNHRMRDDIIYEVLGNIFENPDLQIKAKVNYPF